MALSQEEILAYREKYKLNESPVAHKSGRFSDILGDVKEIGTGIVSAAKQRSSNLGSSMEAQTKGKQGIGSTIFQGVGQAAGLGADVFGEVFKGGAKALLSPEEETAVKQKMGEYGKAVVSNNTIQNIISKYESLDDTTKRNIDATLGIGSLFTEVAGLGVGGRGVQAGKQVLKTGAEQVVDKSGDILNSVRKLTTKAVEKGQDVISPIDEGVQTILTKSKTPTATLAKKFDEYTTQARKAVEDYAQKTPLEIAGEKAETALSSIQKQMSDVGKAKKEITKQLADTNLGNMSKELVRDLSSQISDRLGLKISKTGFKEVAGRLSKVSDPSDLKLLNQVASKLSKAKTFQQMDDAIDFAQDLLFKRKGVSAVPVNSQVESILKGVIGKANTQLKKIGGSKYTQANIKYSNRIKVFEVLNKALGVEGNKGASLMKQLFSPSGTASRKLFAEIKKLTGIYLVEEATLAKFVMENIGDVRQASLLEQVLKGGVPTNTRGLIGIAADKVLGKLQNPIGKAERMIQKR